MFTVYFQVHSANDSKQETVPAGPDLSAGKALSEFVLFIPGVTEGIIAFVVFGTTRTFRDYAWRLLVPKKLWEQREAKKAIDGSTNRPHLRTETSRDHLRDYENLDSGHGTPTTPNFEVMSIDLHDLEAGHGRKGSVRIIEWPIITKVVEPAQV